MRRTIRPLFSVGPDSGKRYKKTAIQISDHLIKSFLQASNKRPSHYQHVNYLATFVPPNVTVPKIIKIKGSPISG